MPLTEKDHYEAYQEEKLREWESLCKRCGACCGVLDGDPCENVYKADDGKYACRVYNNRFGPQQTISGKYFLCVPIRDILHRSWPGDKCCGYKQHLK